MPLPGDPHKKARVDFQSHMDRAIGVANKSFDIDRSLAENERAMGKVRTPSLDKIFPGTTQEDLDDYDRAEKELTDKWEASGTRSPIDPKHVAEQMVDNSRMSDSPTRRAYYNATQDLAATNAYRRGVRQAGKQIPDADLDAQRWADRADELYAKTHRQTGAQSKFYGEDRDMLVDLDLYDESIRNEQNNRKINTFSSLYRGTPQNLDALSYQEYVTGLPVRPKYAFGINVQDDEW